MDKVYALLDPSQLPEPKKMKIPEKNMDTSKYYRYHKDHGNEANDCSKLKE